MNVSFHSASTLSMCAIARIIILFMLLASGMSALAATSDNTGKPPRILRSADVHPDDYPTVQAVLFMSQQIQKASNNRLRIQVFSSGLLGDEVPLMQLVRTGDLDMNRVSAQALDEVSPLIRVLSLPYLFRDENHLHKVLDGPIGREILDSLDKQGLVGLAFYDAGIRNVYAVKRPINTLEDMKGLNIRVQPSNMSMMVFEQLGAKPIELPFVQTTRAISNDLIDSAENNLPSYASSTHYKYAPYYSRTVHTMSPDVVLISKRTWDGLSAADQTIIRKAAQESVAIMRDMWQQREERVEATLKLAGVKFNEVPKEQLARFATAMQPVYARYANDPRQQALIQKIRAVK